MTALIIGAAGRIRNSHSRQLDMGAAPVEVTATPIRQGDRRRLHADATCRSARFRG